MIAVKSMDRVEVNARAPDLGSREVLRCSRQSAPALPPRSSLFSLSPLPPPTSPSKDQTWPTVPSDWKRRSRPKPVRSRSRSRRCVPRRKQRSPGATSAPGCRRSRRSSRSRRAKRATGCGCRARSCRSVPPTNASAPTSSSAPQRPPILRINAPEIPARRPTRSRCSAAPSRNASCGGLRSTPTACPSTCARSRTSAKPTSRCATNMASAFSITRSTPTRPLRAPVSSSRKICRENARISRLSSRLPATTSRRSRPKRSSSASKACAMASAIRSPCAPDFRPPCARTCRSRPTTTSMCVTAAPTCASPAKPTCCRAPASAASRSSASTPRRCRSRCTASATAA